MNQKMAYIFLSLIIFLSLANQTKASVFDTAWYYGGTFNSPSSPEIKSIATTIQIPSQIDTQLNPFYILTSAVDNTGSYDQIGFSNHLNSSTLQYNWVIIYSYTTGSPYHYHTIPAKALVPGSTYIFTISANSGIINYTVYQNSTVFWTDSIETGGNYLTSPTYTDYEEVHSLVIYNALGAGFPSTPKPLPFNVYFYHSNWTSINGIVTDTNWLPYSIGEPANVSLIIEGNSIFIENIKIPLTAIITPISNTLRIGNASQFKLIASGGVPPYTYSWSSNAPFTNCVTFGNSIVPTSSSATNANCNFATYSAVSGFNPFFINEGTTLLAGNYLVNLTVTDYLENVIKVNRTVQVKEASNTMTPYSMDSYLGNIGPTSYYNVTIVNNANTPTNSTAPVLVTYNNNPSRTVFFWDNGTIIKSWFTSGGHSNTYYYLNLSKSIPSESSITIHMGVGPDNGSIDYTGLCKQSYNNGGMVTLQNSICIEPSPIGEAPMYSTTYGAHDNGQMVFNQYDSFISNQTNLNSYNSFYSDWQQNNVTSYGNGLSLNGLLITRKTFNNLNTVILSDLYGSDAIPYGFAPFVPAHDAAGWVDPDTCYVNFGDGPILWTNGSNGYDAHDDYCFGNRNLPSIIGGYNSTSQIAASISNGPSGQAIGNLTNSVYIGSYHVAVGSSFMGHYIAIMSRSAQTPAVNFAPVSYPLANLHPLILNITAFFNFNRLFLGQSIHFNITISNGAYYGSEPYNLSFAIMSKVGSCATSPTSHCIVYQGNSVITHDGTPQTINVTANQIIAYSGSQLPAGNYTIFTTVQKGAAAIAQTYLNFTINNPDVPISTSNNQGSTTGSNFQQMITFSPSNNTYYPYEANDLGNIRFYQSANELYSWCESGCTSNLHPQVPITLTNSQNTLVQSGFQQMMTFNAQTYNAYEASDLGNIRFYQGANELYSWCESGCSSTSSKTVFWIGLSNSISANGNSVVNAIFLSITTEYDGNYAGEAPQLSQSYAQYDNGAKVFNSFYQDFNGTSCPSGASCIGTTSPVINNGIVLNSISTTYSQITYSPSSKQNIIEFYGNVLTASSSGTSILALTGSLGEFLYYEPVLGIPHSGGPTYHATQVADEADYCLASPGNFSTYPSSGYHIYSMELTSSNIIGQYDYNSLSQATSNCAEQYNSIGFSVQETGHLAAYWLRMRVYPTNGIMPSVTFGNVQVTQATFWVKLPAGISANSNAIVNMTFLPTNTEYDGIYAGEAPQLSCNNPSNTVSGCASGQYGKYDNGANVFALYDGFAGNTLSGIWSHTGTVNVDNGVSAVSGSISSASYNSLLYVGDTYGYAIASVCPNICSHNNKMGTLGFDA